MEIEQITNEVSVGAQLRPEDVKALKDAGFRAIVCNRPDGEVPDQPSFEEIKAAAAEQGLAIRHVPVVSSKITEEDVAAFRQALDELSAPLVAYCRSGTRSTTLWSLASAGSLTPDEILQATSAAGYDMTAVVGRMTGGPMTDSAMTDGAMTDSDRATAGPTDTAAEISHDIVVIGAGAAGVAVTASMLKRKPDLDIAIIDPADEHYYQPGWTLVGAGVFKPQKTVRTLASLIPKRAKWIKAAIAAFEPESNTVILEGQQRVRYNRLVVCPGLKLDWGKVEGLVDALGKHGVTSNYRYDLAPYTWECVQNLKSGNAVFTQPPMPIKCAGAPQKAMYLSADHWRRKGRLKDINVHFYNAVDVLFGVKDYVPALMKYVERYDADLHFSHNLVRVDGPGKTAWFDVKTDEGVKQEEVKFDMLHAVPPQTAPDFIKASPLADDNGWVDVDQSTLRHKQFDNVYSLGDVMNAPNAKTAAAARKQAPVVANNLLSDMGHGKVRSIYDGYGSCPLTVERGKIVLAEFGYGGKILPSFPSWVLNGFKPTRRAWFLKEKILPPVYWRLMLRGKEWLATPEKLPKAEA